ncbi:MAG: riboflavin synthase [Planctomycetes bacterium]|nr:riboflavin synthase [Planctomycetota bacterium]
MFTGIIEHVGDVERADFKGGRLRLVVRMPKGAWKGVKVGESIAVDGVCLTVAATSRGRAAFDAVGETCRLTTLGRIRRGGRVNLERAMRAGDKFGGHFVTGHVDGVGRIAKIVQAGGDLLFHVDVPRKLMPELARKGSVAVDGISLTVVAVTGKGFTVTIIPHTLAATTLGGRKAGDPVNLETDVLAKYVRRAAESLRRR